GGEHIHRPHHHNQLRLGLRRGRWNRDDHARNNSDQRLQQRIHSDYHWQLCRSDIHWSIRGIGSKLEYHFAHGAHDAIVGGSGRHRDHLVRHGSGDRAWRQRWIGWRVRRLWRSAWHTLKRHVNQHHGACADRR